MRTSITIFIISTLTFAAIAQNVNKNTSKALRLECPALSTDTNCIYREYWTGDTLTFAYEYNCSLRANVWVAFQMHPGNADIVTYRYTGDFVADDSIPEAYQVKPTEYTAKKFDCGHICASADRFYSRAANKQTFICGSNSHPQYKKHNVMTWKRIENHLQNKLNLNYFRDTLYVVKGATIYDPLTLGKNSDSLIVPGYWFCAILCVKDGEYKAGAFLTKHTNTRYSVFHIRDRMISIDSLEAFTGYDFFCNLPDSIEDAVEAVCDTTQWGKFAE